MPEGLLVHIEDIGLRPDACRVDKHIKCTEGCERFTYNITAAAAAQIACDSCGLYSISFPELRRKRGAVILMPADCNDICALLRKELTCRPPKPFRASNNERIFPL